MGTGMGLIRTMGEVEFAFFVDERGVTLSILSSFEDMAKFSVVDGESWNEFLLFT